LEAAGRAFFERHAEAPRLAIVRVGDDAASGSYLRQITRAFEAHSLRVSVVELPDSSGQTEVANVLDRLGRDVSVHGILLQLPLPAELDSQPLLDQLPLAKDVEGVHPYHAGQLAVGRPSFVPSTPLAGMEMLRRSGIGISGRLAVVLGRSAIVGRPMASLLLQADATVTVCHSRTADLGALARQADILVAAVGRTGLLTGEMVKPGAAVIDFGTNVVDGRLVGDADFASVSQVAGFLTPVPGGTGPVTTAMLGSNLIQAARAQRER
jgi:methylenetetrahydrofolate dehydrogenase (NADP+)/methenyltetrahydrofolate cyclohydrolase